MAWIKWNHGLAGRLEVVKMGQMLRIPAVYVAGCCMVVWEWADRETRSGHAPGVTLTYLDQVTGVKRFGDAMRKVGWLEMDGDGFRFVGWDTHNSDSAKERANWAMRKQRNRHHVTTDDGQKQEPKGYQCHGSMRTESGHDRDQSKSKSKSKNKSINEAPNGASLAVSAVAEPLETQKKPRSEKQIPRDELFDAIAAEFYPSGVSKRDRVRIGVAASSLFEKHARAPDIAIRGAIYREIYPLCGYTPLALADHWDECREPRKASDRLGRAESKPGKYDNVTSIRVDNFDEKDGASMAREAAGSAANWTGGESENRGRHNGKIGVAINALG